MTFSCRDRNQPSGLYTCWTTYTRKRIIAAATTVPLGIGITPQHQFPKPD
ncbi:hypothetical protein IQ264_01185 [Phormidium sp. LEGE 05292]|nr:hypothetical protein [Phormidium sp. LEGE 05292]MBE9224086.1 hypothetical protein [Phormidium sp. LEGE 05292]